MKLFYWCICTKVTLVPAKHGLKHMCVPFLCAIVYFFSTPISFLVFVIDIIIVYLIILIQNTMKLHYTSFIDELNKLHLFNSRNVPWSGYLYLSPCLWCTSWINIKRHIIKIMNCYWRKDCEAIEQIDKIYGIHHLFLSDVSNGFCTCLYFAH